MAPRAALARARPPPRALLAAAQSSLLAAAKSSLLTVPIPISSSPSLPLLPQVEDPPSHAWEQLELLGMVVMGRFLRDEVTHRLFARQNNRDSKRGEREERDRMILAMERRRG